jgi:hypothetical protein
MSKSKKFKPVKAWIALSDGVPIHFRTGTLRECPSIRASYAHKHFSANDYTLFGSKEDAIYHLEKSGEHQWGPLEYIPVLISEYPTPRKVSKPKKNAV